MHYLIDGYNFLFYQSRFQDLSPSRRAAKGEDSKKELQKAREALIDYLADLAQASQSTLTVIFDSPKSTSYLTHDRYCPIEVLYSPSGLSADEWILEALRYPGKTHPKCVVTNDKRLKANIHGLHRHTLSIDEFLQAMHARAARKPKERKKSIGQKRLIDHYTQIFEMRYRTLEADGD